MHFGEFDLESKLKDCRVLVTGCSGFIGQHLCELLLDLGANVYGLSRTCKPPAGCQSLKIDLRNPDALKDAIATIKPQIIYHLAGLVTAQPDRHLVIPMLETNLLGSVNLLMSAEEIKCDRIIMVGSSEEVIDSLDSIPSSPYACAKTCASMYAKMFYKLYSLPVVIVRPFLTYGPKQAVTKLIPYTITSLLQGKTPKVRSGKRLCDFIYVSDVVTGLLQSGIYPNIEGQSIDLGTGIATSVQELVEHLTQLTESSLQPKFDSFPERLYEYNQIANYERTKKILNWSPRWSLSEGLLETVNWYKKTIIPEP